MLQSLEIFCIDNMYSLQVMVYNSKLKFNEELNILFCKGKLWDVFHVKRKLDIFYAKNMVLWSDYTMILYKNYIICIRL